MIEDKEKNDKEDDHNIPLRFHGSMNYGVLHNPIVIFLVHCRIEARSAMSRQSKCSQPLRLSMQPFTPITVYPKIGFLSLPAIMLLDNRFIAKT